MLNAGLDAMVSDVDVAWLRSPWPLVRYGSASQPGGPLQRRCALLALFEELLRSEHAQLSSALVEELPQGTLVRTSDVIMRNAPPRA